MPGTGFNNHIRLYAHSGKCCSGNSTAGDETAVTSVKALTGSHFLHSNFLSVREEWNETIPPVSLNLNPAAGPQYITVMWESEE